ncbi:MAG: hypothetical protein AAB430_03545 [Patescibacteria group bacterium]
MKIIQQKLFNKTQAGILQVKQQIDQLTTDSVMKIALRIGLVAMGLSLIILAIFWGKIAPEIPLWYSRPYGENQLTASWVLWLIPLVGLIINVATIRLSGAVIEEDKFLAQMMTIVSSLITIMALVTMIKVISLVV